MNETDTEGELDDTVEADPGWLLPRGLPREILAADAAAYARIQACSAAVAAQAFAVAAACGPDDMIPYGVSLTGWLAPDYLGAQAGTIDVPRELCPPGGFALTVVGHCMTGDAILDGDIVIVDPHATVEDGDIAVVGRRSPDTAGMMLKRVYRDGENLRLVPSNPEYETIVLTPADNPVIIGRVFAVMRNPYARKGNEHVAAG